MSKISMTENMKHLIDYSIRLYHKMKINSHQTNINYVLSPEWNNLLKFNHCYSMHNSVTAYVLNSNVYVTPLHNAYITLQNEGFDEKHFWVPLSNFEHPVNELKQWTFLLAKSKQLKNKSQNQN